MNDLKCFLSSWYRKALETKVQDRLRSSIPADSQLMRQTLICEWGSWSPMLSHQKQEMMYFSKEYSYPIGTVFLEQLSVHGFALHILINNFKFQHLNYNKYTILNWR